MCYVFVDVSYCCMVVYVCMYIYIYIHMYIYIYIHTYIHIMCLLLAMTQTDMHRQAKQGDGKWGMTQLGFVHRRVKVSMLARNWAITYKCAG